MTAGQILELGPLILALVSLFQVDWNHCSEPSSSIKPELTVFCDVTSHSNRGQEDVVAWGLPKGWMAFYSFIPCPMLRTSYIIFSTQDKVKMSRPLFKRKRGRGWTGDMKKR